MRQLVNQIYYTRYQFSFYLWQIGPVLEHCKVPIYYDQDRSLIVASNDKIKCENRIKLLGAYDVNKLSFDQLCKISKRKSLTK